MKAKNNDRRRKKVGEGRENSALPGNKTKKEEYPLPTEKDEQLKNQPEFIERDSNKKDRSL